MKLDLDRIRAIASNPIELDVGLIEMLPGSARDFLVQGPRAIQSLLDQVAELDSENKTNVARVSELNLAIVEYATQSGQGQLMLDNLKLCIEQVRNRRAQVTPAANTLAKLQCQPKG